MRLNLPFGAQMRAWALCVLTLGLVGCVSGCVSGLGSHALVLGPSWTSPDFRRVYLKGETGLPSPSGLESRGLVSGNYSQSRGERSPQRACDNLKDRAIEGLLLKAEKLGANSIREMESRESRDWQARLVCVIRPGDYPFADPEVVLTVRGLAVYDPGIESSGAAASRPTPPEPPRDIQYESFLEECLSGPHRSRRPKTRRSKLCTDLEECLSGYTMSRRPEATRNEMCVLRLRSKYEDFDAVTGAQE